MHRDRKDSDSACRDNRNHRQYVNRIIKKGDGVMNKTFVQMLDALGYDIELHYVKKEEV